MPGPSIDRPRRPKGAQGAVRAQGRSAIKCGTEAPFGRKAMRRSSLQKALTEFEIGILVLSFIATLAWLYLVFKITSVLDALQHNLSALLGSA